MPKQNAEERKNLKLIISKVKTLIHTMEKIIDNSKEVGFNYSSCNNFAKIYQQLLNEAQSIVKTDYIVHIYNLNKLKSVFDMTGIEQKMLFESVYCSAQMLLDTLESHFDYVDDEIPHVFDDETRYVFYLFYKGIFSRIYKT